MAKKHAMLRTCRKAYRNACYAGLTSLPGSSKRGMKREALETRLTQATLGLVDILRVIISIFGYGCISSYCCQMSDWLLQNKLFHIECLVVV